MSDVINSISESCGKVVAIICDNNRVNQNMFKSFPTVEDKPWLTVNRIFLLFDYVHIIKNVRNNWYTEKTKQIEFRAPCEYSPQLAKWQDLLDLHRLESGNLVTLSRLDSKSVAPKPVERQKVSTCLKVFSDETVSALKTHPGIDANEVTGTITFLNVFINCWKILNVRSLSEGDRFRDPYRAAISDSTDPRLDELLSIAEMVESMNAKNGIKRCKTFTKDTAYAISHTMRGIVEMAKTLLCSSHEFVLLGQFSSDPLERCFSKLRQGAGGAYFISVQQALEKMRIEHAKLVLRLDIDISNLSDGHSCDNCCRKMTERECELVSDLEELEAKLSDETKMSLVYISGYLERHHQEMDSDGSSSTYYQLYGKFIDSISRGGLRKPSDETCQWVILCYIFFVGMEFSKGVCRTSLCEYFDQIKTIHRFNIPFQFCRCLSNILLNNRSKFCSPHSTREPAQKLLKLM